MNKLNVPELADGILSGDKRSLARGITAVENKNEGSRELLESVYNRVGGAHRIGVTGPPGSGKSTLIKSLAGDFADRDISVGVVAVDPSSPFTGGALLGDRVRMSSARDPLVFIRSMASRGRQGGLAPTTLQVCDLLDAAGKDILLVETVGVGQADVEVSGLVDTTMLVLTPESGDSIQAMKAGLMEIGDFIVVNKSDREGADRVEHEIRSILRMKASRTDSSDETSDLLPDAEGNTPSDGREEDNDGAPVDVKMFQTSASSGEGVDELLAALLDRREAYSGSPAEEARRKTHARNQLQIVFKTEFEQVLENSSTFNARRDDLIQKIQERDVSPYTASRKLMESLNLSTSQEVNLSSHE